MKKGIALLICIALLFGCAAADQVVELPDSRYVINIPDGMVYSKPQKGDDGVHAYLLSDLLEMDYLSYAVEDTAAPDPLESLKDRAKKLEAAGMDVELRLVNGIELIVYRITDETDGTPGIGYVLEDGRMAVEVIFWFATQEAADLSQSIMETIRINE
ncbi:MAG: hypothetical protein K6F61_11760 [Clostridiales bacterium]|nr:hypothetical protein [Clostridiales bacterium]